MLEEALLRLRGELVAVGLELVYDRQTPITDTLPKLDPHTYAAIVFDKTGGLYHIRVYSAESDAAAQVIDPSEAEVNAEVIAVRTVELLRATMLQYARRSHGRGETLPDSVRAFTGLDEEPEPARSKPSAEPPPEPLRPPTPEIDQGGPRLEPAAAGAMRPKPRLSLWFAPALQVQADGSLPSLRARASLLFGQAWYAIGAGVAATVRPLVLNDPSGSVDIGSNVVTLQLRANYQPLSASELFVQVGGGMAFFSIEAQANSGFLAQNSTHTTGIFGIELGAVYWVHDNLGVYLSLCSSLVTDAPRILLDEREVATLWQPALAFSAGLALALPDFHSLEPAAAE